MMRLMVLSEAWRGLEDSKGSSGLYLGSWESGLAL